MSLEYGILLGFIGITATIVGFIIAYHYGSKSKPKDATPNPLKDLMDK